MTQPEIFSQETGAALRANLGKWTRGGQVNRTDGRPYQIIADEKFFELMARRGYTLDTLDCLKCEAETRNLLPISAKAGEEMCSAPALPASSLADNAIDTAIASQSALAAAQQERIDQLERELAEAKEENARLLEENARLLEATTTSLESDTAALVAKYSPDTVIVDRNG